MQLGVSERMHFAGKMSDPSPVIALADVCVRVPTLRGSLTSSSSTCSLASQSSARKWEGIQNSCCQAGPVKSCPLVMRLLWGVQSPRCSTIPRARRRTGRRAIVVLLTCLPHQSCSSTTLLCTGSWREAGSRRRGIGQVMLPKGARRRPSSLTNPVFRALSLSPGVRLS